MQKLNALTTLRFFAAMGIVLYHGRGYYGIPSWEILAGFSQGIAFFFILSGFILAYVYPELKSPEERKKFYIARIARIWPAHFFLFLLVIALAFSGWIANEGNFKTAILNLFMVQAWVPVMKSYFSFNGPSWSISTEFFFYLSFPFLICNWWKTWHWKILGVFTLPFILMYISAFFSLPDYTNENKGFSNLGLLYIHPLARIPEFTIGIATAFIWMKYKKWLEIDSLKGTLLEIAVLILFIINLYFYHSIAAQVSRLIPSYISHEFQIWTGYGIFTSLSFALILFIFASGKGALTKILSHPLGVFLGEISFSIYLVHQIVHRFYLCNATMFENFSGFGIAVFYWSLLFLGSFIIWKYIEGPSRKWILESWMGWSKSPAFIRD